MSTTTISDRVLAEIRDRRAETDPPADGGFLRRHTIDAIVHINPTAVPEFLEQFRDSQLATYLRHLEAARRPRGRDAAWPRPGDSPAVMGRDCPI